MFSSKESEVKGNPHASWPEMFLVLKLEELHPGKLLNR